MELIPVFAFIVLVASIATFIFSLAAYVLYKVREKRGRYGLQPHPKAFKAELVTPNYYYLPSNESGFEENNIIINDFSFDNEIPSNNKYGDNNYQNDAGGIDKKNGNDLTWR